ncbi:MAG TPA: TIGR03915 family putative DNA repair protein [Pyrinomonadaceae bacterium]|nr:TIGR03915 family putative DNA repair protein [Pyrinomonadaceae bacterium]
MIQVSIQNNFASWRAAARQFLQAGIAPEEILWTGAAQNCLFENDLASQSAGQSKEKILKVPADFLRIAESVACFDDFCKWSLLYRLLFRLVYENRNLLAIESDDDVRRALLMEKAVARDVHKFHAFVRFRRAEFDGKEFFAAWHVPAHFTVERAAPFFARRFGAMFFSIFTPKGCAHWDLENLTYTEAVSSDSAPKTDEMEDFWLAYYKSIFNPFRLKIKAMKKELPVRHWRTLPEAGLIPELIRQAREKKK